MGKYNLQVRLGIILSIFFGIVLVLQVFRAIDISGQKIQKEQDSISEMVSGMLSLVESQAEPIFNLENEPVLLQQLLALEKIRHIDIRIQPANADNQQVSGASSRSLDVPDWYIGLVYPENETKIREFQQINGDIVSLYIDPGDEIEEVWLDTRNRLVASFIFLVLLLWVIVYLTSRWMKPIELITKVLEEVESGDFSRRVTASGLPELQKISDHINHLTTSLGSSNSENQRLTRKSLLVQEQERRYLAQELHDSLGQSISAIKAIAVSIEGRALESDPLTSQSAKNIEKIADEAYHSVRKLMTSLRPFVLDELGLKASLDQMIDDWNIHHEDTFCRHRIESSLSNLYEEQQINVYRIEQEALTNISKYARAENVHIILSGNEIISLLIVDDGVGFAMNEMTQSMGLTGIKDRVTLLQGDFQISSRPGKGVSIQIEFPRKSYFRRRSGDYE